VDAGLAEAADFDVVDRLVEDARFELADEAVERREDAGLEVLEDAVERLDAAVERRDAAGLAAVERREDAGLEAVERRDDAGLAAVEDAVERLEAAVERRADAGFAVEDLRAVDARRAAGFFAAERLAAGVDVDAAPGRSSADTRFARPSTSFRRPLSSSTTRSSSTSRIRLTAPASSPANSCAGPRSDCAPSAVAVNVRSTAERTASTASTAPAGALSCLPLFFFFVSFFAMAARS
jgi:hypothetical protein